MKYGVLAFGDSITNGGGELQWGVALQSWALWTARALGLPYTSYALDGAGAADVAGRQIADFRERSADPGARYDVGALYVGANDVRALDWNAAAFERDFREALGFDPDQPRSPHRIENHPAHRVVYTGTHDHDTIRGWYESLDALRRAEVDAAVAAQGVGEREPWWSLIRLALSSPARLAMVQAQDVLGLGSEARMNTPGRAGGWKWRLAPGQLTPKLAKRLRAATEESGRNVPHHPL